MDGVYNKDAILLNPWEEQWGMSFLRMPVQQEVPPILLAKSAVQSIPLCQCPYEPVKPFNAADSLCSNRRLRPWEMPF